MKAKLIDTVYVGKEVYSLRHKKYGIIKYIDEGKGCLVSFSNNKYNYEYHYFNEIRN